MPSCRGMYVTVGFDSTPFNASSCMISLYLSLPRSRWTAINLDLLFRWNFPALALYSMNARAASLFLVKKLTSRQCNQSSVQIIDYLFPPTDIIAICPHRSTCTNFSGMVALRPSFCEKSSLFFFLSRQSTHLSSFLWPLLTGGIPVVVFLWCPYIVQQSYHGQHDLISNLIARCYFW